ncbi:MAG: BtaA family protein [Tepidisphaeraceae bacterium]|jgi:S-adenosylmethionine-diacylglycerol 3-amino-3-carboxypropyl transferase
MNLAHWLHNRCFNLVHGHQLIYNQCWEDPRLDRQAMQLKPHDVMLVITSAGCNVLDYLLDEPAHIHAVDLNLRQNALLELKIAGIRRLEFDQFFAMFGEGKLDDAAAIYRSQLRRDLSDPARAFWDRHIGCFEGSVARNSFYFHGTTGVFAWLMNLYIDYVAGAREIIDAMLGASTVEEQSRLYSGQLQPIFWKKPVRWAVRRNATLSLLGVPRPQREQIERDYFGGIGQFMEDCVRTVFGALPLKDNYFWRVYLTGRYTRDCCPNYLKRENFQRLRSGLIDRVSIHTTSVAGLLEREKLHISRYVLLDHMDWLSAGDGASLQQEWQAIVNRAAPDTRVLWRSAGSRTDYVDRVAVAVGGRSRRVGDILNYHREEANRLHAVDRVHTYGSFSIADLAKC